MKRYHGDLKYLRSPCKIQNLYSFSERRQYNIGWRQIDSGYKPLTSNTYIRIIYIWRQWYKLSRSREILAKVSYLHANFANFSQFLINISRVISRVLTFVERNRWIRAFGSCSALKKNFIENYRETNALAVLILRRL